VGVTLKELAAQYALQSIRGFGPAKFREIYHAERTFREVIDDPGRFPARGTIGETLRKEIAGVHDRFSEFEDRAQKQIATASKLGARIVVYHSVEYPSQLLNSNDPVPALYLLGSTGVLSDPRTVALVGSRKIRDPYARLHTEAARSAVRLGLTVVSGFALGADTLGHRAAYESGGRTICVMPSGLDRPFPPENRRFWQELMRYDKAALVSEFPFGTGASSLTLRKRNKLIVALSQGVLMSQSAQGGGAMNAYRFALEVKRPFATFTHDATDETSGNREAAVAGKGDVTEIHRDFVDEVETWLSRLSSSI
jgi:DNA processing protein